MYSIQTTASSNQSSDLQQIKYDAAYRKANGKKRIMGHHSLYSGSRGHEAVAAVQRRSEPWMKHLSVSSRDLIWGSCSSKEEEFMSFRPKIPPSDGSPPIPPAQLKKVKSALSSIPGNENITSASMDDGLPSRIRRDFPRFRHDLIMDKVDVDLHMKDLQTTLQRSISSDSLPNEPQLMYSESFIASQEEIMTQIERNATTFQPPSPEMQRQQQAGVHTAIPSSVATTKSLSPSRVSIPSKQGSFDHSSEERLDSIGSTVRIHDKERVLSAMNQGTAQILQCIGCAKHMMVTSDVELAYCPSCGTLTPFEMGTFPNGVSYGLRTP